MYIVSQAVYIYVRRICVSYVFHLLQYVALYVMTKISIECYYAAISTDRAEIHKSIIHHFITSPATYIIYLAYYNKYKNIIHHCRTCPTKKVLSGSEQVVIHDVVMDVLLVNTSGSGMLWYATKLAKSILVWLYIQS